jgi:2-succinyl-6-hydroxy-2,4-cyclohexadiene-1-carboxylate synthase
MDHLGITQTHLVGYSMGGRLALYLLCHYRHRFNRAVIESASPGLKSETERQERRDHDEQLARRLESEPFEQFLNFWHQKPIFSTLNHESPQFGAMLTRRLGSDPGGLARSLRYMGTGSQPSLWGELSGLDRTLFIVGEYDTKYQAIAAEMASLCAGARTAIIGDAGHNVHFEQPDAYCGAVRQFLAGR